MGSSNISALSETIRYSVSLSVFTLLFVNRVAGGKSHCVDKAADLTFNTIKWYCSTWQFFLVEKITSHIIIHMYPSLIVLLLYF